MYAILFKFVTRVYIMGEFAQYIVFVLMLLALVVVDVSTIVFYMG
jgi:hypothetical protein